MKKWDFFKSKNGMSSKLKKSKQFGSPKKWDMHGHQKVRKDSFGHQKVGLSLLRWDGWRVCIILDLLASHSLGMIV